MAAQFYQNTETGEIIHATMMPTHDLARFRPYKGPIETDSPCDERCTSAKGPECNCQCGGINHGIDYTLASGQSSLF